MGRYIVLMLISLVTISLHSANYSFSKNEIQVVNDTICIEKSDYVILDSSYYRMKIRIYDAVEILKATGNYVPQFKLELGEDWYIVRAQDILSSAMPADCDISYLLGYMEIVDNDWIIRLHFSYELQKYFRNNAPY